MKQIFRILFFGLISSLAFAQSPTEIVQKIEKNLSPNNYNGLYHFINLRNDGTKTEYEVRFVSSDVDHSHGTFIKPAREKGREVLRLNDVLWSYMPSVGRAVRIADRDSFAGGDFSNADILRIDWTKKYSVQLLKESKKQWIFEMKAKTTDAAYAKMRLWVSKKNQQPVQQNFYDSKGTLLKQLRYGSVKSFDKITRPARLVMKNVITGQKSELLVRQFQVGKKIPGRRFVVENLGK